MKTTLVLHCVKHACATRIGSTGLPILNENIDKQLEGIRGIPHTSSGRAQPDCCRWGLDSGYCEKQSLSVAYGDNTISVTFPSWSFMWQHHGSLVMTTFHPAHQRHSSRPFPSSTWGLTLEHSQSRIYTWKDQGWPTLPKPATPLLGRKASLSISGWFSQNKQTNKQME